MLKKTIGFLIFFLALFFQMGIENVVNFFDKQIIAFILSASLGLFIINYDHDMSKEYLLNKVKKYVLFSGIVASLIQLMDLLYKYSFDNTLDKTVFLHILIPFFWAYVIYMIIDTMIKEN